MSYRLSASTLRGAGLASTEAFSSTGTEGTLNMDADADGQARKVPSAWLLMGMHFTGKLGESADACQWRCTESCVCAYIYIYILI